MLHPKLQFLLWMAARRQEPPISEISPAQLRKANTERLSRLKPLLDYAPTELPHLYDKSIDTPDGDKIGIRIYRPNTRPNLPMVMFFHGGGFVLYDLETHDSIVRRMAYLTGCIWIAVDYRRAPEYKYPVAAEDCYTATLWASRNAPLIGGNPHQIAVCGDSAGGNLATVVCMMARDRDTIRIAHQSLIYPCIDATMATPSYYNLANGYYLTREGMAWFWKHYIRTEADRIQPYCSPLMAEDVRHLPPALIITAEYDPLKDEGKQYATRLHEAGNEVQHYEYKGMIHGFFSMPKLLRKSRHLHQLIASNIQTVFGLQGLVR